MKQKFYICKHCGNTVAMIRDAGVPMLCCGEKMHEIKAGITEASGEKPMLLHPRPAPKRYSASVQTFASFCTKAGRSSFSLR